VIVDGYLLDTQTICYWFDANDGHFPKVAEAIERLPNESPIYMSVITLGEIAYGREINPSGAGPKRERFHQFVLDKLPQIIPIGESTVGPYGQIRAHLAERCKPKGGWNNKRRAEQMIDPITGLDLGIDEHDLWLVAQAVERQLVFVTKDHMTRIRNAVNEVFPKIRIEDWTI
jgi:predicted nucleic acid-binding protein